LWREFYTISQRSHKASLFYDETSSIEKFHITSRMDADAARV
jgi:hypothetical protein